MSEAEDVGNVELIGERERLGEAPEVRADLDVDVSAAWGKKIRDAHAGAGIDRGEVIDLRRGERVARERISSAIELAGQVRDVEVKLREQLEPIIDFYVFRCWKRHQVAERPVVCIDRMTLAIVKEDPELTDGLIYCKKLYMKDGPS